MTPAEEVQELLRFLTKEARVPLALAMSKIHELRKSNLNSPDLIAKTSLPNVQTHFPDDKLARQVFNAAKRVGKRATAGDIKTPAGKRSRSPERTVQTNDDPAALENSLRLPVSNASEDELKATVLQTNRAPLVLAFAVMLLKYTMPEQPLSSRLSLAQANVSMNSKSKAQAIGLDASKSAEQEGWAQGQPQVKVLGRPVPVMRRAGYRIRDVNTPSDETPNKRPKLEEEPRGSEDELGRYVEELPEEALWGLDLEALRKSNRHLVQNAPASSFNGLPIYSPHSARAYLLRSVVLIEEDESPFPTQTTLKAEPVSSEGSSRNSKMSISKPVDPKKKSPAELAAEKERAVGLLLQAIDMLMQSWAGSLNTDELDRKAWGWYMTVRPDVASGQKGWGQKGDLRLGRILALRKAG